MMVFTSIYGVVDGLFISNVAGKHPFAAINLIMPALMILGGFGFMIGAGGSALVAKTQGEGDSDRANRYFTMMIKFTVISGIILSAIGIIFIKQIAILLGAGNDIIGDCIKYGIIILIFNTAFMLQSVFQVFLTTAQKPTLGLVVTVAAGITNMILDAIFIAGFRMGVAGAALATGISQSVGALIPLVYFIKSKNCPLRLVKTKLEARVLLHACTNGASELMSNISGSIVSMVYNFCLLKYAGNDGIAAYGTLMYIQFIFVAIFIGYTIGTSPIISYHYGAQNHVELKNLLKKSMLIMSLTGFLMAVSAILLSVPLAKIFVGYDEGLYNMTVHAFRILAFSFLLTGINIFISSFFTALNNGVVSAVISFLRTLLFQSTSVIVLSAIFKLDGIWWAGTAAECFALVISLIFLFSQKKKYHYM